MNPFAKINFGLIIIHFLTGRSLIFPNNIFTFWSDALSYFLIILAAFEHSCTDALAKRILSSAKNKWDKVGAPLHIWMPWMSLFNAKGDQFRESISTDNKKIRRNWIPLSQTPRGHNIPTHSTIYFKIERDTSDTTHNTTHPRIIEPHFDHNSLNETPFNSVIGFTHIEFQSKSIQLLSRKHHSTLKETLASITLIMK